MSQKERLSMGGCRHCLTQLWRDMSTTELNWHLSGKCRPNVQD